MRRDACDACLHFHRHARARVTPIIPECVTCVTGVCEEKPDWTASARNKSIYGD
jgi:hypothetical protein